MRTGGGQQWVQWRHRVTEVRARLEDSWARDDAEGASFFGERPRLDALMVELLGVCPPDEQASFIEALPLPHVEQASGPYVELDESDPDAVMRFAILFSAAAALPSLPVVAPQVFGLVLDRPWPWDDTSYFWSEWDALVAHLGRLVASCSDEEAAVLVTSCEWAAVAAAAQLRDSQAVISACVARTHWFDSTAEHATRGMLLLNTAVPETVRSSIVREVAAIDWYWAVQRLPSDGAAGTLIDDTSKWEAITDLAVASGATVADSALQAFASTALHAIREDANAMVVYGDIGWDVTVDVFGTLAVQPGLSDDTLREIAQIDSGSCAKFVLDNPSASAETRALAWLHIT